MASTTVSEPTSRAQCPRGQARPCSLEWPRGSFWNVSDAIWGVSLTVLKAWDAADALLARVCEVIQCRSLAGKEEGVCSRPSTSKGVRGFSQKEERECRAGAPGDACADRGLP